MSAGAGDRTELPAYVQIEPVGQCNLRCQMCAVQFRAAGPPHGPPALMPFEIFTSLIDQFAGVRELHLQGLGEPLLHPRFFDMVRYATGRGIRVSSNSNLTLLSRRQADEMVTCGLDCMHVSIDAATAETYERIRRGARYATVLRNVERLLAARRRLGARSPRLRLVAVVMRQNLHELPSLVQLAADMEMEGLFVQHLSHEFGEGDLPAAYAPMRQFVREQTLVGVEPALIAEHFDGARRLAGSRGIELRLPRTEARLQEGGRHCDWPWTGVYIDYAGTAMPCCMVSTADRANLGNMARQGVQAVWNGAPAIEFRRRLASDVPPDVCHSCSLYWGTF